MPETWALATLLAEGGPFMPLILLTAFVGLVLAVERLLVWLWWRWRDRVLYRAGSQEALLHALSAEAARPPTPLASVLHFASTLLARSPLPTAAEREALLAPQILARMPQVEARLSTIAWIGGVLPMMGLLGTVTGLISTFNELAQSSSRQVLSQGLSEALWTTEVGMLGALALLAVHHLLSLWRDRWLNALEHGLALLASNAQTADSSTAAPAQTVGDES